MGGRGSSRWGEYTPHRLVEDTPRLDFLSSEWRAVLKHPAASGSLRWNDSTGSCTAQAAFELGAAGENGSRILTLEFEGWGRMTHLTLEPIAVGFSMRTHARCPAGCGGRARSLFLLPENRRIGCRRCCGLDYASAQKSDHRVNLARLDPRAFLEGRAHLRSFRSAIVTARVFEEAQRRGRLRVTPRRLRKVLLAGAAPEAWESVEKSDSQQGL